MELPNLDYAFLAEYAKVEPSGLLTAVGASFTVLTVSQFPAAQLLSVAGRLRMAERGPRFRVSMVFAGPEPDDAGELRLDMTVEHGTETAYEGRVGVLFAATTVMPILHPGLHTVRLLIEDEEARLLAFQARPPEQG